MKSDICIIGGGAAGMMAAIAAKEKNPSLRVVILERLSRVGKKISVTGNGRCNITNKNPDISRYHGMLPSFASPLLERFSVEFTEAFFENIGVPIVYEGDKGFPASFQAASVTDALRFHCDELGVITECEQRVTDIQKDGGGYLVVTDKSRFFAKAVIAAAGMLSGGEKFGCDGSAFSILKNMGIRYSAPSPAIVKLKTDTEIVRQLKGIKVNAGVSVYDKKGILKRTDFGEVLFCDYGLSGPPILQVSGDCNEGDTVSLDLVPYLNFALLKEKLTARAKNLTSRNCDEFLSGFINKRLGQVVLKRCNLPLNYAVSLLGAKDIDSVCRMLKAFKTTVRGLGGFLDSQVTRGGLLCSEFDNVTLMCKKHSGLFAAGEILDIDGDCGGFNLQWAWSSGYAAGLAAADYVER